MCVRLNQRNMMQSIHPFRIVAYIFSLSHVLHNLPMTIRQSLFALRSVHNSSTDASCTHLQGFWSGSCRGSSGFLFLWQEDQDVWLWWAWWRGG